MTNSFVRSRGRGVAIAALLLALAALLAACGSSSSGGSTSAASSAASTTASATGPVGRPDFARLRACLQQQGVTLPRPPAVAPGQAQPPGRVVRRDFRPRGLFLSRLSSAQRARLSAAMQKCGAPFGRFRRFGPDFRSPAFRRALAAYVACVRRNGFDLPAPNTSGSGPIFDPRTVNRQDPRFIAANARCQQLLAAARPAPPGGAPPPSGQGG
jgi:hypothetical protein